MKRILCATALVVFAFGTAIAQADKVPPSDSNPGARPANNPATTPLPAASQPAFDTIDTNKDGSVTQMEFDAKKLQGMTLSQVDTNKDGTISRDEWSTQKKNSDDMQRK
ncbi:MAG TPA: EF-hand domain-containing protein [Tahibacter sp.]|uniref:EF-hand domain-containing protein n=1 Tax=Tahibacter sp. TaxID=2056211 RepID=UPI002BD2E01E|nr:EF-hand domain-containing protein [Tahibacter sp.]HSX60625.1 EF-hand domain-containing protein [Tahibacter sp.]